MKKRVTNIKLAKMAKYNATIAMRIASFATHF